MTDRATPSSDPATPGTPTQPNQPAASTEIKQPFLGPWQAVTVLMVLLALLGALLISISRFTASADVVAILGVLVTPIVSIGAAAFGVTIAAEKAAEAGAAAGDANAAAATAEKDRTTLEKQQGAEEVAKAREAIEPMLATLERVGSSRSGSRQFELNFAAEDGSPIGEEIALSQVTAVREHLIRASEILGKGR